MGKKGFADMEFITGWPALLKVVTVFVFILVLNRFRLHLSLALFVGAGLLAVFMDLSAGQAAAAVFHGLWDAQVLSLVLLVAVIMVLSRLMSASGQLQRIVDSFTGLVHSIRLASLVMPALIGLLPMPGGALFSAPMVQAAFGDNPAEPELKTAINYWFRHIWEVWWPMYPGVVLAVSLLGVPAWKFILGGMPLTVLAVTGGMLFLWPGLPHGTKASVTEGPWGQRFGRFVNEVWPITLIVLAIPTVKIVEAVTGWSFPPLTSVYLGLGLCLTWVIWRNRVPLADVRKAMLQKSDYMLLLLVLGIMGFKGMLVESRAVVQIQEELTRQGIPSLLVILAMPFLSGFITGVAMGFVGASFPLVIPLIAGKTGLDYLAYGSLAYAFGWLGMMLSPVHVCFLVTKDFYAAGMAGSYRHMIGPALWFTAGALGIFGLTRLFV